MEFPHRKLLQQNDLSTCAKKCSPVFNKDGSCSVSCFPQCVGVCKSLKTPSNYSNCSFFPCQSPPPPPPPLSLSLPIKFHNEKTLNQKHVIKTSLTITSCMIGGVAVLFIIYMIMKRYFSRLNNSRSRDFPILFDTHQGFIDEDRGPVIDHHIWFINTVGLPQSIIDSITVLKYKKDDGLVEGTECAVCLSEFEEDESLRLLPKCSHAFHIPCIDTWLRSHKNCPLCRAPIVSDIASAQRVLTEPSLSDSGPMEETQIENLENHGGGLATNQILGETSGVRDVGDDDIGISENGSYSENPSKGLPNSEDGNSLSLVLSGLGDKPEVNDEEDLQPVRRSFSMDATSAMAIYADSQLLNLKKLKSKQSSGNLSFYKLMKKGSPSMKRSSSSSRKFSSLSSKHYRSQSSILPS
ncbi:hypothetical protein FNV43_RR17514 [Rhamnella rubrinervis]|uniref:RING-type E3 ubiquitin transferase n=1 Tax=Rhamnella rubrinervis TaxID=2594499 RepID=A0A8K0GUX3_9ROSA|nr:hypothetical protein FNV43_RR17514 [Rhamnella rubrinervis]